MTAPSDIEFVGVDRKSIRGGRETKLGPVIRRLARSDSHDGQDTEPIATPLSASNSSRL